MKIISIIVFVLCFYVTYAMAIDTVVIAPSGLALTHTVVTDRAKEVFDYYNAMTKPIADGQAKLKNLSSSIEAFNRMQALKKSDEVNPELWTQDMENVYNKMHLNTWKFLNDFDNAMGRKDK